MEEWEKRQKHHNDVYSLGPEEGIWQIKSGLNKGFVYKYQGTKVQKALKKLGHSSLSYENCICAKDS